VGESEILGNNRMLESYFNFQNTLDI